MRWTIIKLFSSRNIFGFTFQDVAREFPEKNNIYLGRVLADMVAKGMLCKISRDNYHIIPFNADPDTYLPDRHQVAKYLMRNKEYYIGYDSALEIHGLKIHGHGSSGLKIPGHGSPGHGSPGHSSPGHSSPGFKSPGLDHVEAWEYVVTNKQRNPAIRSFGETNFQFIVHDASRFFGFSSIWINQLEKASVSDLEKTIVDIATKPQFCGGIIELGNAIFHGNDRIDQDKLFYCLARNNNKSAKKRILFLTDILGLAWTADHDRMMKELGSGISLLDPTAYDQGRKRKKFGLKINVDPTHIKEKVLQGK